MTPETASYDVFDTVVTRTFAHPRDLFVELGRQLHARGTLPVDALTFARARWKAELDARRDRGRACPEVVLADIYRTLAHATGWPPEALTAAQALELELESRHLRGVPRVRATLDDDRRRAGRLVFLSDMYLPAATLRPWLEREGAAKPGDELLVSGEARGNKSSGDLFRIARERTGGDFNRWTHTGDHPFADDQSPRGLGIATRPFRAALLTPREQRVRATTGEFTEPWRSFLAGAMRLARLERDLADPRQRLLWDTGATVAGPLFHGFARWVLHEARRRGVRRLYFLARDGQILCRVAQAVAQPPDATIECLYLAGSRLAFAGPSELGAEPDLRMLAAPTGHHHSLRQSLQQLGLEPETTRPHLPAAFARRGLDENLPPDDREVLAAWLLAPDRRGTIARGVAERRRRARAFVDQEGLRAGEPVALVDAGWLGSIQRNLEHIIGADGNPAPLLGFYLGLMPPQPPPPRGEMLGYANTFAPFPLLREESHKVLVELLARSDHGQVSGFVEQAGRWTPSQLPPGPVDLAEVRLFHDAVLAFARRMEDVITDAQPPWREYHRATLGIYRDFHDQPTRDEAALFGSLPHADQLLEQGYASLCRPAGLGELCGWLLDYRRRPPHWWVQGQAALGHAPLLHGFRLLKLLKWKLTGRPA